MDEFKDRIQNPEIWFHQAWEMFEASKAIYDNFNQLKIRSMQDNYRHIGLMKASMMTLGYALENALKGAYVFRYKPKIENGIFKTNFFPGNNHDLPKIAKELELNIEDTDLFERMHRFIVWSTKYKAPKYENDFKVSKGMNYLKESDFSEAKSYIELLQTNSGYSGEAGWPAM